MCVSLVPHRALINCARLVTFDKVLTGASASEPSSRPPFSPLLPRRLIYRPVFYESCSSLLLISRRRSDGARQKKAGSVTAFCNKKTSRPSTPSAQPRSWWLTHGCLCGFKVFHPSTFIPLLPVCGLPLGGGDGGVIPLLGSHP